MEKNGIVEQWNGGRMDFKKCENKEN